MLSSWWDSSWVWKCGGRKWWQCSSAFIFLDPQGSPGPACWIWAPNPSEQGAGWGQPQALILACGVRYSLQTTLATLTCGAKGWASLPYTINGIWEVKIQSLKSTKAYSERLWEVVFYPEHRETESKYHAISFYMLENTYVFILCILLVK